MLSVAQAFRTAPRLRLVSAASAAEAGQVDRWKLQRQGRARRHPCLALVERSRVKLVGPRFKLQVRDNSNQHSHGDSVHYQFVDQSVEPFGTTSLCRRSQPSRSPQLAAGVRRAVAACGMPGGGGGQAGVERGVRARGPRRALQRAD